MSTKVTASTPGSHLPPDSHSSPRFQRQPRPDAQADPAPESGNSTIDAFQRRCLNEEEEALRACVQHAVSFSQTQAGFLRAAQRALDRMSQLSILCQDNNQTDSDRANYTSEFTQLQHFISDIGTKRFNGLKLFPGLSLESTFGSDGRPLPVEGIPLNAQTPEGGLAEAYDVRSTVVKTDEQAAGAFTTITKALQNLAGMQERVCANIERLNLSDHQLAVLRKDLLAATSRSNALDLAQGLAGVMRDTMLSQSGTAMVAQANTVPQAALKLLE